MRFLSIEQDKLLAIGITQKTYQIYISIDNAITWSLAREIEKINLEGEIKDVFQGIMKDNQINCISIIKGSNKNIYFETDDLMRPADPSAEGLTNLYKNYNYSIYRYSFPTSAVGEFFSFSISPQNPYKRIFADAVSNQVILGRYDSNQNYELLELSSLKMALLKDFYKFNEDFICEILTFSFDPECDSHILAGTRHDGIFETFDDGQSWNKIPGTDAYPYISSFFYSVDKSIFFSSFGKGIGKIGNKRGEINVSDMTICKDENKIYIPGQGLQTIIR